MVTVSSCVVYCYFCYFKCRNELLVDIEGSPRTSYETETTLNYNNRQLMSQQDQILRDQDRGIEALAGIIQNQKRIASTIGNEVDRQNGMQTLKILITKSIYRIEK
jgi:hypothetical protein